MPELNLSLLRSVDITLSCNTVTSFRSIQALALLIYLTVEAHRAHHRDALAGLLWPDSPQRVANHNLSQALVNLRQAIGDKQVQPSFFIAGRKTIQFNMASSYWLDVATFSGHFVAVQQHQHAQLIDCALCIQRLQAAVALYQGAFLDEFPSFGSSGFEEWTLLKRQMLHYQAVEACGYLAGHFNLRRDYACALSYARQQAKLDPLREAAHRQMMRILALDGQRNAALAQYDICRRLIAEELGVEPAPETTALYLEIKRGGFPGQQWGDGSLVLLPPRSVAVPTEVPGLHSFYGRETELTKLEHWMIDDRCRVVALVGLGGVGKTALAARLADRVALQFDQVLWYSLVFAPPLQELLSDCLQVLSAQPLSAIPMSLHTQLAALLGSLRQRRCLLVFDGVENIMSDGELAGNYRPGYQGYGQLIQWVSQSRHLSCLVLVSREQPAELAGANSPGALAQVLRLSGLEAEAGRAILQEQGISGSSWEQNRLIQCYSGNPLALQIVADTIRNVFAGDIALFLRYQILIFGAIRTVLDQQFAKLSALERDILIWVARMPSAVSIASIQTDLVQPAGGRAVLEAVRSLQQRSLLEQQQDGLGLPEVVTLYLAEPSGG
jgi:DNA-binding SARP family transcriptional activator